MNGQNYVFIKTANNDAYMNSVDNFRGADHQGDTAVDLYFDAVQGSTNGGAYDKISLVVTSEKEQQVMTAIGGALAGSRKTMVVIAEDFASSYVDSAITSVGTISRGITGVQRVVEVVTNASATARTLLNTESGKLFQCNMTTVDNNVTFTLPTAATSAGVFYDFVLTAASDDDADLIITTGLDATNIYGTIDTLAAVSTNTIVNGHSLITLDASVAQTVGARISLMCDGVHWSLSGHVPTAVGTPHVTSAADA